MGGALRRIMQPELEEATREGERKGINLTIKYFIIDGIPNDTIVSRLVEGFGLDEKDAVKYIEEYKERYDG